jgi:hypothetical protein
VNHNTNLAAISFRLFLRRVRNWLAVVVMIAAFAQFVGVPKVSTDGRRFALRVVTLERPVWEYVHEGARAGWTLVSKEHAR